MTTKISLYQTNTIMPIANRAPGVTVLPVYAECDTIVMTVFVASIDPGTVVKVDITEAIVGAEDGEAYSLGGTGDISETGSRRYSVRGFLCNPLFTVTHTGGFARFGVVIAGKQNIPFAPNNTTDFSLIYTDGITTLLDDNGNVISA